jgi:hypothetical protein
LVAFTPGERALELEVTIISDMIDPSMLSIEKLKSYTRELALLNWVEEKTGCDRRSISFDGIVLNWRGAMCMKTEQCLHEQKVTEAEMQLTFVRCPEVRYMRWQNFRTLRGTVDIAAMIRGTLSEFVDLLVTEYNRL